MLSTALLINKGFWIPPEARSTKANKTIMEYKPPPA
jgi:hypothetical protein